MKALADHIHSLGLKAGLYTSPGPLTCAEFTGSYQHEAVDARRFADWGFDFLKYDYCSYHSIISQKRKLTPKDYEVPYARMGGLLKNQSRDIVFNLCEYGEGDVWSWVDAAGGNSWRTTGDLGMELATSLPGFLQYRSRKCQARRVRRARVMERPGLHLAGLHRKRQGFHSACQVTDLTPDEQYSYMSM
jgi:alpha-galactosidase